MGLVARLEEMGKLPLIALMVLGFIFFWPVGLAILFFLIWSNRMSCGRDGGRGRWHYEREQMRDTARGWWSHHSARRSSGNRAFDEYKAETLRRLEEEQKEFFEFLDRLRHAKDKAEFDEFMRDRGRRPGGNTGPEPQPQA